MRLGLRSDFFFVGLGALLVASFNNGDGPRLRDARYWLFARMVASRSSSYAERPTVVIAPSSSVSA